MIRIGLTGSIGMGKSTTAKFFAAHGVPVHDADATVHALYQAEAVAPVEALFPGVTENGVINRQKLSEKVLGNPEALKALTDVVHPLVRQKEVEFLQRARQNAKRIVVLDIPLLFETGGDERVDVCLVVTASEAVQRERVLARPGMSEDRFQSILAKQMPDAEKRRRAHFLIDTGFGMEAADRSVQAVLRALAGAG